MHPYSTFLRTLRDICHRVENLLNRYRLLLGTSRDLLRVDKYLIYRIFHPQERSCSTFGEVDPFLYSFPDTRVVSEADRIFGGPMPAACLYAPQSFIDKNPATVQALTNAIVRADKWIQAAGAGDIIKVVPESYLLGDRAVYVDAFLAAKGALSSDGMFPEAGAETARRALASIDPEIANAKIDLAAIYTNDFVKKANAKYPRA